MRNNKIECNESDFAELYAIAKNLPNILDHSKEVPIEEILKKICVSSPYFAFNKIIKLNEFFITKIIPEQNIGNEKSPIAITEAGRHLAILGSCCHANREGEKHFYLANFAKMKLMTDNTKLTDFLPIIDNELFLAVKINDKNDDRNVWASGAIFSFKTPLYYIDVRYQKLTKRLFERLFKNYYYETTHYLTSPYKDIDQKFNLINNTNDTNFEFEIAPVKEKICAGHFDNYPMIPVSVSAYLISRAAGECFLIKNKEADSYLVNNLNLEVFSPSSPFAKKKLQINTYNSQYHCELLGEDNKIEMKIILNLE